MTRRDNGLFAGFNLTDTRSIRSLHASLKYWLGGGRATNRGAFAKLSKLQRSTIEMIAQRMDRSPLLQDIIMPFLDLPKGDSAQLQLAARDLDSYAVTAAYEPKTGTYNEAENSWKTRQPLSLQGHVLPDHQATLNRVLAGIKLEQAAKKARRKEGYRASGYSLIGNFELLSASESDTEDDSDISERSIVLPVPPVPTVQKEADHQTLLYVSKVPQIERNARNPLGLATHGRGNRQTMGTDKAREGKGTKRKQFWANDTDAASLTKESNGPVARMKSKEKVYRDYEDLGSYESGRASRAVIEPGHVIINGDEIDRTCARRGVIEPAKLILNFVTAMSDPHHIGQTVPGTEKPLTYIHTRAADDFDWNNVDHLKGLNNWRASAFRRRFSLEQNQGDQGTLGDHGTQGDQGIQGDRGTQGDRGKPRYSWIVSEKRALMKLADQQLRSYGFVKWRRLANSFNRQNTGLMDAADEQILAPGVRSTNVLGKSRFKPWRTAGAVAVFLKRFPDFQDLQATFDSRKRKITKSDDEEDPEPSIGPRPMMDRESSKGVNVNMSKPGGVLKGRKRRHSDNENIEWG